MRRISTTAGLIGAMALAGCAGFPDMMGAPAPSPAPAPAPMIAPMPEPAEDIGIRRSASAAEAACVAQGETQGMNVQSVVGTREVAGGDGRPVSRDVLLRVARGEQVFDVRCSYDYASSEARIMTL
jgi:hypothetical protein